MHSLRQAVVLAVVSYVRAVASVEQLHLAVVLERLDMPLLLLLALLHDEVYRLFEGYVHRVSACRYGHILGVVLYLRAESSCADRYDMTLEITEITWQRE